MICPRCRSVAPEQAPFCPSCRMSFVAAPPTLAMRSAHVDWRHRLERFLSFGDTPWKNFAVGASIVTLFALWAVGDIIENAGRKPHRIHWVYADPEPDELEVAFILVDEEGRPMSARGKLTVDIMALSSRGWIVAHRHSRRVSFADFRQVKIGGRERLACYQAISYKASADLSAAHRAGSPARVRVSFEPQGAQRLDGKVVELAGL